MQNLVLETAKIDESFSHIDFSIDYLKIIFIDMKNAGILQISNIPTQ